VSKFGFRIQKYLGYTPKFALEQIEELATIGQSMLLPTTGILIAIEDTYLQEVCL